MGKYLDMLRGGAARSERGEISEKRDLDADPKPTVARLSRLFRILKELERCCPDHIAVGDWQQAIRDGRRFLDRWLVMTAPA
jgi:hypothetical protein